MAEDDQITLSALIQERYKNAGAKPGKAKPHRPQKPCQYEGCNGWAWARGYCDNHYQKLKREGKIKSTRIVGDPVARFHASYQVNPTNGCWEWTGWIHPKGYGILVIGGKSKKIRAHRFSWELHRGPIPDGMQALHICDNRKCCNPDHLFIGDDTANMRDCANKGRNNVPDGRKLTDQQALCVRILYARGLVVPEKRSPYSMVKLARIYGVEHETIRNIVKARAYLNPVSNPLVLGSGRVVTA